MRILDCETIHSMYDGLETITDVSVKKIKLFLNEFDLNDYNESLSSNESDEGNKLIFKKFKSEFEPSFEYDAACWFHISRTFDSNSFEKGILPLGEILDDIWVFLFSLVEKEFSYGDWKRFKQNLDNNRESQVSPTYGYRLSEPKLGGPDAYLIRDMAFKAKDVRILNDYFEAPEIVKDICRCFQKRYNIDLLEKYKQNTEKCIVKFISKKFVRPTDVGYVLLYLYEILHKIEIEDECAICFPGDGEIIPKEDILNIEIVD